MAREERILSALLSTAGAVPAHGIVGPGDDAAVVPASAFGDASVVLTCDALEEDVHFRRGWMSWKDLAHKLLAVSLSDLAAMSAEPVGALVAVAWPASEGVEAARELGAGLREACGAWSCPLLGGDTDVRPGTLRLEATVVGRAERPALRSTAVAGDSLFVTGPLGGAALAVAAWLADSPLDPDNPDEADALARFRRPLPRLDMGRALRGRARALIDLSDGLVPDLRRLAGASGLAARIDAASVPLHAAVRRRGALDLALHGGEDYELLVAGEPGLAQHLTGLSRVGELRHGEPGAVEIA